MFREVVNQFNTELILPSDLHDTVLRQQVDTGDELMLVNEMVARKLLCGNENRCARHAMESAV
jgi:hypothetical protein